MSSAICLDFSVRLASDRTITASRQSGSPSRQKFLGPAEQLCSLPAGQENDQAAYQPQQHLFLQFAHE